MKAGQIKSKPVQSTRLTSVPTKTAPTKTASTKAPPQKVTPEIQGEAYLLRLYVAGKTPKSLAAFVNLKKICEQHLAGQYRLEVIDLLENPTLAGGDQILAIPTLVRRLPEPIRKIIGDLSNTERVLIGLDVRQREVEKHD